MKGNHVLNTLIKKKVIIQLTPGLELIVIFLANQLPFNQLFKEPTFKKKEIWESKIEETFPQREKFKKKWRWKIWSATVLSLQLNILVNRHQPNFDIRWRFRTVILYKISKKNYRKWGTTFPKLALVNLIVCKMPTNVVVISKPHLTK